MEQYDVYSSRMGLTDTTVSLQRNHAKLKRDKGDFMDDGIKIAAVKIPRQSLPNMDNVALVNHSESGAMSVLPRLLRTMTNGGCHDSSPCGAVNNQNVATASTETNSVNGTENRTLGAVAAVAGNPDTDSSSSSSSSSSASSFVSPPSTGSSSSSLISFLSPGGQLGSVAMAAAAVLSAPTTSNSSQNGNTVAAVSAPATTSVHDAPESSGLVTLATASSLIEQEWLARAAFASSSSAAHDGNQNVGAPGAGSCAENTTTMTTTPSPAGDLVTLTVEHGSDPNAAASPPLLFKTLTTNQSPQSQINGATTPVTRAVLNFQSFAAFIRETQKQCSSRSTPTTPLELPLNSVFPVSSAANTSELSQTTPPCAGDTRSCSPPRLTYSCAPTAATGSMSPPPIQSIPGEALLITDSVPTDGGGATVDSGASGSQQPTAFISLQPAPGSILSSSDLQQLMTSGEFMSSAARQTLLGQSPDGSTRQLYLLVPSDCPVIMSRASNNQSGSTTLTSVSSPLLNSTGATSAPILEAISPGVEPDESCDPLPPTLSHSHPPTGVSTSQSVHVALPAQLAGAVLAPMSSATTTALSTLIAGLEVRGQSSQQTRYTNPVPSNTSTAPVTWSNTSERATVHTTDSVIPNSPRVRLPLNIPGVTLSEHSHLLSTDQSIYTNASINGVSSLLGAIKSDPDMYTPNGHPYASLVEDVTRFRSYPTYTQSVTHQQVPVASVRTAPGPSASNAVATNTVFFQPDLSASLLLPPQPQSALVSTAASGTNTGGTMDNGAGQVMNNANTSSNNGGGHLIQTNSLSRVNATFATASSSSSSGASSATSVAVASPSALLTSSNGKPPMDDCRRNMTGTLLSAAAAAAAAAAASTATPTGSGRPDSGPTTYLEHLNPESKDIRRRVSHNEVERRRRDRINTWISELYKLLPPDEQAKSQYQSKGVVLKRVCEYFQNVDSMLKAANAAVEQTRVENGLLRQRVRELEQENQLLSASLHLGAAAAAVHLRHRQPRQSSNLLHSDESVNGNGMDTLSSMKDSVDQASGDYPAAVTVFAVGSNADYANNNTHTVTFTQAPVTVPLSANASVASTFSNNNSSTVATENGNPSCSSSTSAPPGSAAPATAVFVTTPATASGSVLLNPTAGRPPPLTLPSLDLVANYSDTRTD